MSWFKLDPQSVVARVTFAGAIVSAPTLAQSVCRGIVGFTVVSIAGFLPWALAGAWFYHNSGELVLYLSCAVIFIGPSGLLMSPLIIGPDALKRFYMFFSVAFGAYSLFWIAGWMGSRGQTMHVRSAAGLFAGTAVMGILFGFAFDARGAIVKIAAALFILNSLGYFVGGWIESCLSQTKELNLIAFTLHGATLGVFMNVMWGLCYGIGLGAGLVYAFYTAQARTRTRLAEDHIHAAPVKTPT